MNPANSQSTRTVPVQKTDSNEMDDAMSDDGDLACSQALDNIEESQLLSGEPELKIPKIDVHSFQRPANRLTLNLNRFAFTAPIKPPTAINPSIPSTSTSNPNENEPIEPIDPIKPKRNRIFCTPSDDENSQNDGAQEQPAKKLPFQLNFIPSKLSGQRPLVQQQQNVNETKDSESSENDSAYDSMQLSSKSSTPSFITFGSAAKTGKTPPIYGPCSGATGNLADQDLSVLDSLDF